MQGKTVGVFVNCPSDAKPTVGNDISREPQINGSVNFQDKSIAQQIAAVLKFNLNGGPIITQSNISSFGTLDLVTQAYDSIQNGTCTHAIVAGINLLTDEGQEVKSSISKEWVVALFMQKKEFARREYLSIIQVAKNSSTENNKTPMQFLTDCYKMAAASSAEQVAYLDLALDNNNKDSSEISEMFNTIETVFKNGEAIKPFTILSEDMDSKYAYASSGLVRFIKLVFAVQHGIIPCSMMTLATNNSSVNQVRENGRN